MQPLGHAPHFLQAGKFTYILLPPMPTQPAPEPQPKAAAEK